MRGRAGASAAALARLAQLARLRADRETARLAETARARARLRSALDQLGVAPDPLDPAVEPEAPVPVGPAGPGAGAPSSAEPPAPPAAADGGGPAPDPGRARDAGAGGRGPTPAGPPAGIAPQLIRARLAYRLWLDGQRAELLARLARLEADWRRLHPPAAAAFGRAEALKAMAEAAARAEAGHRRQRETELAIDRTVGTTVGTRGPSPAGTDPPVPAPAQRVPRAPP